MGTSYGFALSLLAATVVAVWVAYDEGKAVERFFFLFGGFVAVLVAPLLGKSCSTQMTVRILGGAAALVGAFASAIYLAQSLGTGSQAWDFAAGWGLSANPNLIAQLLAMTAPVLGAVLWIPWTQKRRGSTLLVGGLLMLSLTTLTLTGSRGAFLGVGAIGAAFGYFRLRGVLKRRFQSSRWLWLLDGAALLSVAGAALVYVVIVASPRLDAQLGIQDASALSRLDLWRSSLPLIADYYFTGSGLGAAVMVYATYAYLLHVPYLYHAHNLYLHLALEQGVVALLAWLGLVVATAVYAVGALRIAKRPIRVFLIGGLAGLGAFLVHSLFEAELFYSALAAFVFFTPTLLLWGASTAYEVAVEGIQPVHFSSASLAGGLVFGLATPFLLAALMSGGEARWEANLGAVLQTQVELGTYQRPPWSFQDEVRRRLRAELTPAQLHFEAALALNPSQPTAHRRLGAIALAQGAFERAKTHLLAAYASAPYDRATRQMLGEIYALEGDVDAAMQMWQGLDFSQGQLMVRQWWYQALGEPEQVERLNNAIRAYQRLQ
ncbi:MAG: O-antigen ligase family protein [Caldilinea sp.]|nr:O-antigen ligase family protein [Caldilinea sp.]MDW8442755.1 O-antigen ligase family protein [Caldilineaceae bacterium]